MHGLSFVADCAFMVHVDDMVLFMSGNIIWNTHSTQPFALDFDDSKNFGAPELKVSTV